jgi:hypothetical protein
MGRSYSFAIVRFAPDEVRGESLNIGAIVFRDDGLDIRITRKLDRVRAISGALDPTTVAAIVENLSVLDAESLRQGVKADQDRAKLIGHVGPLKVSQLGTFTAESGMSYENRVDGLLRLLVEPEPSITKTKQKRTRLFSEIKTVFKKNRVLARKDEGLDSHRIVPTYELDDGLVADMVLQNGVFHVIETVDANGDETAFRRAITEIAVSALVLERARMKYGKPGTKTRLVYQASKGLERAARPSLDAAQHQGTELINWASVDDRNSFVKSLSSLATPLIDPKRKDFVARSTRDLFH